MSDNPYRAPAGEETKSLQSQPEVIRPVTALLLGATLIPVGLFVLALGNYLYFSFTGPSTFTGDPNIGLGILQLTFVLNLPILFAWLVWLFAKPTKD